MNDSGNDGLLRRRTHTKWFQIVRFGYKHSKTFLALYCEVILLVFTLHLSSILLRSPANRSNLSTGYYCFPRNSFPTNYRI